MISRNRYFMSGDDLIERSARNFTDCEIMWRTQPKGICVAHKLQVDQFWDRVRDARWMLRHGVAPAEVRAKHGGIVLRSAKEL